MSDTLQAVSGVLGLVGGLCGMTCAVLVRRGRRLLAKQDARAELARQGAVERLRADPTRTAVLEHDELGIPPEPGSAAAVQVAMRSTTACTEHEPIETTSIGDPRPSGMCGRCGVGMVQDEDGQWVLAAACPHGRVRERQLHPDDHVDDPLWGRCLDCGLQVVAGPGGRWTLMED